ncbi:unnamed protein product [Dibothriocephalus latus]|uniref:Uncharacterized protein n=1 Tax=Dibothriocephalus latus TaxID=60516 RepID=A0A3P6S538_DIBLA|nr:unnamed protein product [Dibothriocephalus latus]
MGDYDQKTFQQPASDFYVVLEETETTHTSVTINNSITSIIDCGQESAIRQLIREVGEPNDYSESQSEFPVTPVNDDSDKVYQFGESPGEAGWHFIAQQSFHMLIEKQSTKQYEINNPAADSLCTLCWDYKGKSLGTSKSETHLYGKETFWPHGGQTKELSAKISLQSTNDPGLSDSAKQYKSSESPRSSHSPLRPSDLSESGDKPLQSSPPESRTTDQTPDSRESEKSPTDRTVLNAEEAQGSRDDSETSGATNTFASEHCSPTHGQLPTATLMPERSGYRLPPDTSTQEMGRSHNLEDIGQNGNSVLLGKNNTVKGEQSDGDLTSGFQDKNKYSKPTSEKMSSISTHKPDAVVIPPDQSQPSERSERGAHEQPKEGYLLEETRLHRRNSKDTIDTERGLRDSVREEDKQEGMYAAGPGSSLSSKLGLPSAEYYPGQQTGLQDIAEEREEEECSRGQGGAKAVSISSSGGDRKPKPRQFAGATDFSDEEAAKNISGKPSAPPKDVHASLSRGAGEPERDPGSFVPISPDRLTNDPHAISATPASVLGSANLLPDSASPSQPESGEPTVVGEELPEQTTESSKSSQKTLNNDKVLEPVREAEQTFAENTQSVNKASDDTRTSHLDKRPSDGDTQDDEAVTQGVDKGSDEEKRTQNNVLVRQPGDEQIGKNLTDLEVAPKQPRCKRKARSTADAGLPERKWAIEACRRQLHSAPPDMDLMGYEKHTVSSSNQFTSTSEKDPLKRSAEGGSPSAANGADQKTADFVKDGETPTMNSAVDGIGPVCCEPIEAAPLVVSPRSHRMTEENKPAQTPCNQPSSQKVDLSLIHSTSDISGANAMPSAENSTEPIHFTPIDGMIVRIYHECGTYKRNVGTQIDNVRVYCVVDGEYFRDVQEEIPQLKWLILKERCLGTSPYDPRKEDISNIDSPVSLSAAPSYGSDICLLGRDVRDDEKISRIIEALNGFETGKCAPYVYV